MQVLREILPPRVQHRGNADHPAKVLRIAAEGEQRVDRGAEEQRVDHARIALRERIEQMRECKDDVEVRNGQEVGVARREPSFLGERLTLGAMPVAAGVVRDPHRAAAVTRLPMPAEDGGAAGLDRAQHSLLDGGEAVRATVRVAMGAHDVRELHSRTDDRDRRAHWHGAHGISPVAAA